jgi:hypothetical protein
MSKYGEVKKVKSENVKKFLLANSRDFDFHKTLC